MTKLWYKLLSWYEDWQDLRAARKALKKGEFVSWDDFKKELDFSTPLPKQSGTIKVRFKYIGRSKPIPINETEQ